MGCTSGSFSRAQQWLPKRERLVSRLSKKVGDGRGVSTTATSAALRHLPHRGQQH
jgi:hypothetical protein